MYLIYNFKKPQLNICLPIIVMSDTDSTFNLLCDNADTIVGNCDTTLIFDGKKKTTLKEISEILGKETIDSFNTSETRGRELSHGLNFQKLGKDMPYLFVKSSVALNLS